MFGLCIIVEGLYRLEVCIGIGKGEKAWLGGSCSELIGSIPRQGLLCSG